jgi:hypothetical protein
VLLDDLLDICSTLSYSVPTWYSLLADTLSILRPLGPFQDVDAVAKNVIGGGTSGTPDVPPTHDYRSPHPALEGRGRPGPPLLRLDVADLLGRAGPLRHRVRCGRLGPPRPSSDPRDRVAGLGVIPSGHDLLLCSVPEPP